jgi:hypothetical protein
MSPHQEVFYWINAIAFAAIAFFLLWSLLDWVAS